MDKIKLPLWLEYPTYPSGCIGWRMGGGEDYVIKFYNWFDTLTKDEQENYHRMFPEPKHWNSHEEKRVKKYLGYIDVIYWTEGGYPIYNKNNLVIDIKNGKEKEFTFFYGHQRSWDGQIKKSCFSQWWEDEFYVGSLSFLTAEHYMMFSKAEIFEDKEIAKEIEKCKTPKEAKKLGRKVRNFDNTVWDELKYSVVLNGNYWKFVSNPRLREFLLSTGDKVLVEASPYDGIWGIGMTEHDKGVQNPENWLGENLLGFALMEVRDELRRIYKNYNKANI